MVTKIKNMDRINVKVEKSTAGYSAYAEKYAAFTTGDNMTQLAANMVESLNLYFEEEGKQSVITPSDTSFKEN